MHNEEGAWIGYGLGDSGDAVVKINHRLYAAFPANSKARELGVVDNSPYYSDATKDAVINIARYINASPADLERLAGGKPLTVAAEQGVADLALRTAIGAYVPPPPPVRRQRYPIQGVWHDSRAFLNPPDAPSYNRDTDGFASEGVRLYEGMIGTPIIPIGYSMGGGSVQKFLTALRPEWRQYVKAAVTFGDPAMPPGGSLNGDMPYEGISRLFQPEWVRDRYWSYAIDGDWYPQARGLLPLLYQVLTRAELTLDFAVYLFTQFPAQAFQELLGTKPSTDPLAGILGPLAGLMTTGTSGQIGQLLSPLGLMAVLPNLVYLLFDAVKFLATNAHGQYGNPDYALWGGMTAVDHAANIIRQHVPDGATLFLFPGTWSTWDQLFQMDVAVRLSGDLLP